MNPFDRLMWCIRVLAARTDEERDAVVAACQQYCDELRHAQNSNMEKP